MKITFLNLFFLWSTLILAQGIKVKKTFYPDNSIKSEHIYEEGNKKSYKKNYFETGKLKSEGWLYNQLKSEFWIFYHQNGIVQSKGLYSKNVKTGWWEFFDEYETKTKEGHYSSGIKNGYWKFYKNNRLILAGKFLRDRKVGSWIIYDEHGKIKQVVEYGE